MAVMRDLSRAQLAFQVAGGDVDRFLVTRYRGTEGLCRLYRFEIELACDEEAVALNEVVGQAATLSISIDQGERYFHGIVSRFERTGETVEQAYYRAELVPSLWLLGTGALWLRWRPIAVELVRGGRRTGGPALLCGVLALGLLAASAWWPVRSGHSVAPLLQSLCLVLLVPTAEELFFRGLLLDQLRRGFGLPVAVVGVSALFGLLHAPQGAFWPMAVLSMVLCAVTGLTASVLWAAVLHVAWNAASVLVREPSPSHRWVLAAVAGGLLVGASAWGRHSRSRPEAGS